MIQWLPQIIGQAWKWFRPIARNFVIVHNGQQIDGRLRKVLCGALIVGIMIGFNLPLTAWTADLPSLGLVKSRAVVVAGIGYENDETSKLTVKTYDAESGATLSDETFELDVREDAALAGSEASERIFAGGVGPGAEGLSSFTLRAYDAATGKFLWEGLLNLTAGNQEAGSPYQVAAHLVARHATVTRVGSRGAVDGQLQFFLRAVDSATGQILWTDQFSAGIGNLARAEYVSRAVVGQTEGLAAPSLQIQFRIRMTDDQGRKVLWEDTIEPVGDETDLAAAHDDAAEILPAWRGAVPEEVEKEMI